MLDVKKRIMTQDRYCPPRDSQMRHMSNSNSARRSNAMPWEGYLAWSRRSGNAFLKKFSWLKDLWKRRIKQRGEGWCFSGGNSRYKGHMWVWGAELSIRDRKKMFNLPLETTYLIHLTLGTLATVTVVEEKKKWPLKEIHVLIPESCVYYLKMAKRRVSAHVTKLSILRWGVHPGLSLWTLNSTISVIIKGNQGEIWWDTQTIEIWRQSKERFEEARVLEWCDNQPKNAISHQALEEARNGFSLRAFRRSKVLPTPWFQFSPSRTTIQISLVLSYQVCDNLK